MKPLTSEGKQNGALIAFELEADKILTDALSPVKLRYIRRVGNEAQFDPLFVEVPGVQACLQDGALADRKAIIRRAGAGHLPGRPFSGARLADALESTFPDVVADDVIAARML